jgi:Lon protease-like protein
LETSGATVADDERRLPLFPLNTVLFPGAPLPLRIFEERYKLMLAACLDGDKSFGVALIREGPEVGGPAEPFDVGTLARIVDVERLQDGQMHLMTVGVRRFRLLRVLEHEPYLVGEVRMLPDGEEDVEPELVAGVAEGFLAYLRELRASDADGAPRLAEEPEALSFQVAAGLAIAAKRRQQLLELDSTVERLRRLRGIVRREHQTVQLLRRATPKGNAGPFSLN